jgi:short-subunit dehydrogenase
MQPTTLSHILITGATGGIGAELAGQLARRDVRLSFVARDASRLDGLVGAVAGTAYSATAIVADLGDSRAAGDIVAEARRRHGPIDVLVNNAALPGFGHIADLAPADIERVFAVNVLAPVLLARAVVPEMCARGRGQIVNIGSIFGSIGFAGFSAYSSGKFALRGFSEALRRELDGSGVSVTYVAPRYTKTGLNAPAVRSLAEATGMAMDEPQDVARQIVAAIERRQAELVIGRAERFFVRINALWPKLVDRGLAKTTRRIRDIVNRAA